MLNGVHEKRLRRTKTFCSFYSCETDKQKVVKANSNVMKSIYVWSANAKSVRYCAHAQCALSLWSPPVTLQERI